VALATGVSLGETLLGVEISTLAVALCLFVNGLERQAGSKINAKMMPIIFAFFINEPLGLPPNGLRYPRVGGRRERHFAGTSFEPRKRLENAATPTRRVHAVLGSF